MSPLREEPGFSQEDARMHDMVAVPRSVRLAAHARAFAAAAHGSQTYGASLPYVVHLDATVAVLKRFGYDDPILLAAGYLHDVIEDAGATVTLGQLEDEFGRSVALLVAAVTDPSGESRSERKRKLYRRLADAGPEATVLKLADRLANVEASARGGISPDAGRFEMYRGEHASMKAALRVHGEADALWGALEDALELRS